MTAPNDTGKKPLFAGILDRGVPLARVPDYRTILAASSTVPALTYTDKKGAPWHVYDMGSSGWYGDGHERYPPPLKDSPTSFWDIFLPSDTPGLYAGSWTDLQSKINVYASLHTPLEPKPGPKAPPVPPDPTKTEPGLPSSLPGIVTVAPTTPLGRYTLANATIRGNNPSLHAPTRQIRLAIGEFESGFGAIPSWHYKDPKTGLSVPSWNWGGIMAFEDTPGFSHGDKDKDGKPIAAKFRIYPNILEGYKGFLATWGRPDTLSFAEDGDAWGTAEAMYAHGYYGGVAGDARARVRAYAKEIFDTSKTIAAALGEPHQVIYHEPPAGTPIPTPKPPTPGTGGGDGTGVGTVALYAAGGAALGFGLYKAFG